jgi:hypothetical protein
MGTPKPHRFTEKQVPLLLRQETSLDENRLCLLCQFVYQ